MAVYTPLEENLVRHMLSIYDVGELSELVPIAAGSINTNYRVVTDRGAWFLRVNEGKRFRDLVYEKNLLVALDERAPKLGGVHAPKIVENVIGGHFFPIKKKYACLFEELQGRELGVFELLPDHARQLGAFLARAHRALRRYRGGRTNPYGLPVMQRWMDGIARRSDEPDLVRWLRDRLGWVARGRRPLPRGVIHGDLFMNNTKWRRGDLFAVFDWEMAGPDHLALDLGICLNAWGYKRDERAFDLELCRALLDGYRAVRPLSASEERGLFRETVLGALRFTLSRIRDFHLTDDEPEEAVPVDIATPAEARASSSSPVRDFLDYREYRDRADVLWEMGAARFREALLA